MVAKVKPLVVILGSTASGKSDLAMKLAKKFTGEIICADSRTVYKGMDIGTAKPNVSEQKAVKHHLLDVVNPDQTYNVVDFKRDALEVIDDITSRDKVPFLVGGSGMYIDSVIFDFQFRPVNEKLRQDLELLDLNELQKRALEVGLNKDSLEFKNKRRLIRVVETGGVAQKNTKLREHTLLIGLDVQKEELHKRIEQRVDKMMANGFIDEVRGLTKKYEENLKAFDAPGYRPFFLYLKKEMSLEQAKAEFVRNDKLLARKQKTWFKRNKSIQWVNNPSEAVEITTTFLNNY